MTETVANLDYLDNLFGRGTPSIGNMVGYAKARKAQLCGYNVGNRTDDVGPRSGLVYEMLLLGRSVRERHSQ